MRTWQLNEPLIRDMRDRLEQRLPARLQLIADDVGAAGEDRRVLQRPAQVLDYLPPATHLHSFPVVAIGDDPSTIEDDTGSSATGRHTLLLLAFLTHVDQRVLSWGLRRYAQAMLAVAIEGRRIGSGPDAAWGLGAGQILPGPTFEGGEDPRTLLSWTGVRVWARRDEV